MRGLSFYLLLNTQVVCEGLTDTDKRPRIPGPEKDILVFIASAVAQGPPLMPVPEAQHPQDVSERPGDVRLTQWAVFTGGFSM